jgi:quercetin dioxygenase-like cupin family protein
LRETSRFTARPPARSTVLLDGPRSRVTEWRFPPGGHTGWHRHGMDYIVLPMTTGELTAVDAEGERKALLTTGVPYEKTAGVEHDVVNDNPFEFVFIEIEMK